MTITRRKSSVILFLVARRKVWLTTTDRGKLPLGRKSLPQKCIYNTQCTSPGDGQTSSKVWLTSVERRRCSNEAKPRNPLKLAGVPQTNERISAARRPNFTILWGHVEEILLLNKFFSDCRYVPQLQRYSLAKLCDGAQMAIFGDFFASCICSEPRAAHFRPAF